MTRYLRSDHGRPSPTNGTMPAHHTRGFSMIEMLIVVAISLVVTSIGFISMRPILRQTQITNSYNAVLGALRRAHDSAVAERRVYVINFNDTTTPHSVTISQNRTVSNGGTLVTNAQLSQNVTFHVESSGMPASAPDGFGSGARAIDFDQGVGAGGTKTVYFYPDGSGHDAQTNGSINSGIVYFGRVGEIESMRAITVWGTTGRVRGWRLLKNGMAGNKWSPQ